MEIGHFERVQRLQSDKRMLELKNEELDEELKYEQTRLKELSENIDQLNSTNSNLKGKLEQIEARNKILRETNNGWNSRVNDLNSRITTLKAEKENSLSKINELEQQLESVQKVTTELEAIEKWAKFQKFTLSKRIELIKNAEYYTRNRGNVWDLNYMRKVDDFLTSLEKSHLLKLADKLITDK